MSVHSFSRFGRQLHYCPQTNRLLAAAGSDSSAEEIKAWFAQQDTGKKGATEWPGDIVVPPGEEIAARPLMAIDLILTHECNLDCDYCMMFQGRKLSDHATRRMSAATAKQAIDRLMPRIAEGKNSRIRFTGAEPLMNRPVMEEMCDYVYRAYQKGGGQYRIFSLLTNGVALTDALLDKLVKYPFSIQISMDGPAEAHDRHRPLRGARRGSHDKVEAAAKRVLQRTGELHISAVWTPHGPTIAERVRYFEELGVTSLKLSYQHTGLSGDACGALQAADYQQLIGQYQEYLPLLRERVASGRLVLHDPFRGAINRLFGGPDHDRDCNSLGVGGRTVDIDGKLYPCYAFMSMPQYVLGDVWKGDDPAALQRWAATRKGVLMKCGFCWAWPLCRGRNLCEQMDFGCDMTGAHQALCDYLRAMYETALGIAALMQAKREAMGQAGQ
ncbi:MAG: radical SAM protein [Phycisphaeraceae bacterium]|nr:radical SAM protein [Phycisphaeraceae bacterium]